MVGLKKGHGRVLVGWWIHFHRGADCAVVGVEVVGNRSLVVPPFATVGVLVPTQGIGRLIHPYLSPFHETEMTVLSIYVFIQLIAEFIYKRYVSVHVSGILYYK